MPQSTAVGTGPPPFSAWPKLLRDVGDVSSRLSTALDAEARVLRKNGLTLGASSVGG